MFAARTHPPQREEVQVLRAMDHPHIVKLMDVFEEREIVHLVFEPCTGGELFDPIADQTYTFTEHNASRLFRQALDAIAHCHAACIAHRDIKPENMLLATRDGPDASPLKIIDFGLATSVVPGQPLTKRVGTPYYMSPELLGGKYDETSDSWSLGVVLFCIGCGYPPFFGDTERDIYQRIRRGAFKFDGALWEKRTFAMRSMITMLLWKSTSSRMRPSQALRHPWVVYEGQIDYTWRHSERSCNLAARIRQWHLQPWLKRLVLLTIARQYWWPATDLCARSGPLVGKNTTTWTQTPLDDQYLPRRRNDEWCMWWEIDSAATGTITPGMLKTAYLRLADTRLSTADSSLMSKLRHDTHSRSSTRSRGPQSRHSSELGSLHLRGSDEAERLLSTLDIRATGAVTFLEWLTMCMPRTQWAVPERLDYVFNLMDIDQDGIISVQDLTTFAANLAADARITWPYELQDAVAAHAHMQPHKGERDVPPTAAQSQRFPTRAVDSDLSSCVNTILNELHLTPLPTATRALSPACCSGLEATKRGRLARWARKLACWRKSGAQGAASKYALKSGTQGTSSAAIATGLSDSRSALPQAVHLSASSARSKAQIEPREAWVTDDSSSSHHDIVIDPQQGIDYLTFLRAVCGNEATAY